MQNTQIWEAVQTLQSKEYKELERLLDSPFFNRKEPPARLFQYLKNCLETRQTPEASAAFRATFPAETPYNDAKMRLANSDLLALLERYWVLQGWSEDTIRYKTALAAAYRKRNLTKHAGIALREARQARAAAPCRDADYFETGYALELEDYQQASAARRYEAFNLQEISDLLDSAYLARKLRLVCLALSHQAVYKTAYQFGPLEALLEFVAEAPQLQTPAVGLYFHACRFLSDPSAESDFEAFRQLLGTASGLFSVEERRALYLMAINFGIKKCNEGGALVWYEATFRLYQSALELGLMLENGILSRFAYNNIAAFAMRLGETAWAERFITQYKPFLERKYRESAFSMNSARVAYARRDYGAALLHLQKADYRDFINAMNARTLQMKIYYETDEYDLLESHLDSMQHYIRRQRAAGYHRENYLNIVRHARALLRCNLHDPEAVHALRAGIAGEDVLSERAWLLEQLR